MNKFAQYTDDDFDILCIALDVLSGDADLFYILSHPEEFDTCTAALAEYVDSLDCYRQTH